MFRLLDSCFRLLARKKPRKSLFQNKRIETNRFKPSSPKAAEFSGVAGEFRCHSLHRSQISKDL
jgi:hypothetical protein